MTTPHEEQHWYAMCTCGHLGGHICNGVHTTNLQEGHGECTLCECRQFTWSGYMHRQELWLREGDNDE